MATQLRIDLEALEISQPDPPAPPARRLLTQGEIDRLIDEALAAPDPATIRIPRPGDRIEMLWPKPPSRGWYRAVVTSCRYPRDDILWARVDELGTTWAAYVTREARARCLNINRGPLWRWPK